MKLYNKSDNKSGRALILPPEEIVSGGRYQEHDRKKTKCYFDPGKSIEVNEEYGVKLLAMYPEMLIKMDGSSETKTKKKSKKSKVKVG